MTMLSPRKILLKELAIKFLQLQTITHNKLKAIIIFRRKSWTKEMTSWVTMKIYWDPRWAIQWIAKQQTTIYRIIYSQICVTTILREITSTQKAIKVLNQAKNQIREISKLYKWSHLRQANLLSYCRKSNKLYSRKIKSILIEYQARDRWTIKEYKSQV